MSTELDVFMANVQRAVINQKTTVVGGGRFSHGDMHQVYAEIGELKRQALNAERESETLKGTNERLEHDQKLLLEALKQVLDYLLSDDAKTMHDAIQVAKRANAAYRHVTGT